MEKDTEDFVETEEEVIAIPETTADAAADAKVEDGPEEDDSDDDEEETVKAGAGIAGEPLVEGQFTITVVTVIHPSDGHERGQLVTISATSHEKIVPILIVKRMQDLGTLPAWLVDAITKANSNLDSLRQEAEKKRLKRVAEKEKIKKDAAAAQARKDAPKKAKLDKEKAEAKIKADKIKADSKLKADQEKEQKALVKAKSEENKPALVIVEETSPFTPDMFETLLKGKNK